MDSYYNSDCASMTKAGKFGTLTSATTVCPAPSVPSIATDLNSAISTAVRITNIARQLAYKLVGPRPESQSKDGKTPAISFNSAIYDLGKILNEAEGYLIDADNGLGSL